MRKLIPVAIFALTLVACNGDDGSTTGPQTSLETTGEGSCPTDGEQLETAKLYIEHNATDVDTGVHGLFGGEAWSELCLWDPSGNLIFVIDPRNQLGDLTVSDLFFESREPPNDEYSLDDLRSDFPEGIYTAGGTDFKGVPRVGLATLSHDIPAEPTIVTPEVGEEENPPVVPMEGLVVSWTEVAESISGDPITVTGYEVIVTKVDHDDPEGLSRPIYDVHLPPAARSLHVAQDFLEPGSLYELEILVLEQSGNQTIGLGFFETEG